MTNQRKTGPTPAGLRQLAEERLADLAARAPQAPPEDPRRLVHELEVHQVELEMQNEELQAARLEAEEGLQRYTELFDFAPIGYVVLDPGGTIREANLEVARMLGVARKDLLGRRFAVFVDPRQRAALAEFLEGVLARGGDGQASAILDADLPRESDGALEVRLIAVARTGATPGTLLAIHDITARRRAEAALREEGGRKDDFLAALSHELRNPLAPIRNSLSVVERVEPGGEEARKAMAILRRQVDHLVHIVDDLLDVTRIARNKVHLQREPLDLGGLVRRTMDDHLPEFEARGIALEGDIDPEPLWAEADGTRLAQVIGNLLANALKFTPRGGRVDVGLRREGNQAVLTVRDNGVGITPEICARIFEPFIQAPQTLDRSRGGLGLGLAMVKGLVELHGGMVDVTSGGPGLGCEFTVRLPLVAAPQAKAAPAPRAPTSQRRRVLVIEDTVDAADALCDLLALEGHDTRVAYDGPSGIAMARDFRPDVVFCDIGLPEMDGYEVARAMRADDALRGMYLVALSGYARPEDREHSAQAGFDCHLAKPPSTETLIRVIGERPRSGTAAAS
jgi:two-component system CheB/CheR fusion protein